MGMKRLLKRLLPQPLFLLYHWGMAHLAAWWYRYPSSELIVIGVTGTKGKTTTATLVAQFLNLTGHKAGLTSTALMSIGGREWLNDQKMTMPGRFQLQRLLRDMVSDGCEYAVVESSSEGVAQYRHAGIHYDTMVFTNLSPEHIEAHGSYEAYRDKKLELFRHLKRLPVKIHNGKIIPKQVVLNRDDIESELFASIEAGDEWWYGLESGSPKPVGDRDLLAGITSFRPDGLALACRGQELRIPLIGKMNAYNVLAAVAAASARNISFLSLCNVAPKLKPVPGRQEFIRESQSFGVLIDYAHEPSSLAALYSLMAIIPHDHIIHVIGPTGGGRDQWRRPVMGELVANHAHVVIGTTDDPYHDDPSRLIDEMLEGAQSVKASGRAVELLKIVDRRLAIREAFRRAGPKDLVLITGKGAEQRMAIGSDMIPWDDRQVAREELRSLQQ